MIQDSVSLDDENAENCTVILIEMHRHLAKWWKRISDRELDTNEFVHRIISAMFTSDDADHFEIDWSNVVCRRKDVRITLSSLSHESRDSCTTVRRIMLSWFLKMSTDNETLKNVKVETWSELFACHKDLILSARSSSDFVNHYEIIFYRFSAAVELTELEILSDALICRSRWSSSLVQAKRDIILESKNETRRYVIAWRQKTIEVIIRAFQSVKALKRKTFNEKFYFYLRQRTEHEQDISIISNDVNSDSNSDDSNLSFAKAETHRQL
jgi:hypothetical protein